MDDERTTSANLGNDHEFINKEYSPHWYEVFWGAQSKAMRAYGQYHTIVESRVCLTWYQRHVLNLVVPINW